MITRFFRDYLAYLLVTTFTLGLAACGSGSPTTANPTGPTITTQPASLTVNAGQAASFSVSASSTQTIAYQWRRNGTNISGATAATYTIASTVAGDNAAQFSVVVTDPFGSATSNSATLTVNASTPVITTQPQSVSSAEGQSASFSVVATSATTLSYQWRRDSTNIVGATGASYILTPTTLADSGAVFSVVVTNTAGSVTSNTATLTVTQVAPAISVQPVTPLTIVDGATANLQVTATGSAPLTYQWQKAASGSSTFTNIAGATASSYALPAVTVGQAGEQYRVVVTNAVGSVTSAASVLAVTGIAPAITVQPTSRSVADGVGTTFSVTATGSAPLAYQWRVDGVDIPGATSDTYVLATAGLSNDGENYSVVVSNGFGAAATSANALLTVTPVAVTITTQPQTQTVLQNAPVTFSVVATGSMPQTVKWQRAPSGSSTFTDIPGATSGSYSIANAPLGDNGAQFRAIVDNAAGAPATSAAATLTVTQTIFPPVIQTQPVNGTYLEGATASFTVALSAGTSPTYQWQKQPSGGGGVYTDIPGANTATLSFTAAHVDNGAQYRVVIDSTPTSTPATSSAATLTVTQQSVSLLAGALGGVGNTNGAGNVALFNFPVGVSVDGTGITYVADFANHTIRKVLADGTTSTLAGTAGVQGDDDGNGVLATFNSPQDTATDGTYVYVADYANQLIRRITAATGATLTIAGTGSPGGADGTGTAASFNLPRGVALSGTNTLYIAELNGRRIREMNLGTGAVTTIAGTGAYGNADNAVGLSATFGAPFDLAVDPGATAATSDDILYVVDADNNSIRKIDRNVVGDPVTTYVGAAGGGDNTGTSLTAQLNFPAAAALVGTDLYVADANNHVIRKVNTASVDPTIDPNFVVNAVGSPGQAGTTGGVGAAARFFLPYGLAADGTGRLVVANFGSNIIDEVAISGGPTYTSTALAGSATTRGYADDPSGNGSAARFNYPRGLATASNGDNYIADSVNQVIRRVTATGATTTFAGTFGQPGASDGTPGNPLTATFNDPSGVAVDGNNVVYVAEAGNSRIRKIAAGTVTTIYNGPAIVNPRALAVNAAGTALYVASAGNHKIVKITMPANTVSDVAGLGTAGTEVGNRLTARFNGASGLALKADGTRLYVADTGNYQIRSINLASATPDTDATYVTSLAGDNTTQGSADGTGTSAKFTTPVALALDGQGNLHVADYGAHVLRFVNTTTGAATTEVGNPADVGVELGAITTTPLERRGLNGPTGVGLETAGPPGTRLIVIDGTEHVVLRITVAP